MVATGTLEGALGVLVAGSVMLHAWMAYRTQAEIRAVTTSIAAVLPALKDVADLGNPADAIEDVRDEITDTINQVIGAMHVPKAQDHLFGMLAAVVQARFLGPLQQQAAALEPGNALSDTQGDGTV